MNAKHALMNALEVTSQSTGKSELKVSTDGMPKQDTLTLSAFHWEYVDSYNDPSDIQHQCKRAFLVSCLKPSINGKPSEQVLLRIHNVPSVICLKLPQVADGGKWSKDMVRSLCESINSRQSVSGFIGHEFMDDLFPIYYYQSKPDNHLYLYYERDMRDIFKRTIKYPFRVFGNNCYVELVNTQVEAYRWLLNYLELKYTQWFTVKATRVEEGIVKPEYRDHVKEYYIDGYNAIKALSAEESKGLITKSKFIVYDIEAYSPTATFPIPERHDNYIICIGVSYNDWDGNIHNKCFINGSYPITMKAGCELIFCKDEKEMLITYIRFLRSEFWNIMTGYNIYTFDNRYIVERARIWGIDSLDLGITTIVQDDYRSRKFGNKKTNGERDGIPYKMTGRMVFDLFIYLTRDHPTLRSFRLDFVGRHFVGIGKSVGEDTSGGLEPSQIHHGYKQYLTYRNDSIAEVIDCINKRKESKIGFKCECGKSCSVTPMSPVPECVKSKFVKVMEAYRIFELIAVYCDGDVNCTKELFVSPKLNLWNVLMSFSEIMGISPIGLYVDGLQKRVLSQLIYKCWQTGFVLNSRPLHKVEIKGAIVGGEYFGFFSFLTWMDVKSMYPNIIIWLNICYTTLMRPDDDSITDEDCNIIMAEEDLSAYGYKPIKDSSSDKVLYKIRFVKPHIRKGVLPALLIELLKARADISAEIKRIGESNPALAKILDSKQNAVKTSSNAAYGFTGVQETFGELPLAEASIATTQTGREINMKMRDLTVESGGEVIYGDTDSVAGRGNNIQTYDECIDYGNKLCDLINKNIAPLTVEFEKATDCLFIGKRVKQPDKTEILINKKKNYMYRLINLKTRTYDTDIKFKGVVSAKKNNFKFVVELFNTLAKMIFDRSNIRDCILYIFRRMQDLLDGKVHTDNLCYSGKYGGGYSEDSKYYMKKFADKMSEYTQINSGDYIQFIYINTDKVGKVSNVDIMMLYGVFRDYPGKYTVNYMKYVKDCSSHIDDLLYSMYKKELDYLASRGMWHKRSGNAKAVTATKPLLMLWNMLHNMHIDAAIDQIVQFFDFCMDDYVPE
jgi:DNA polymerase elongation subunit (family B)